MIYTADDLEGGRSYDEGDLEWLETDEGVEAALMLDEGDTGPLGVEGPCLAIYRMEGSDGSDLTVITTTP